MVAPEIWRGVIKLTLVVFNISLLIAVVFFFSSCGQQPSTPKELVELYVRAAVSRDYDRLMLCYGDDDRKGFEGIQRDHPKWKEQWLDSLHTGFVMARVGDASQDGSNPDRYLVLVHNVNIGRIKGSFVLMNMRVIVEKRRGRWVFVEALPAPVTRNQD